MTLYNNFAENWILTDSEAGYELYLTGGLIDGKLMIDELLKQKWLDEKVRRFYARFQIYTPDVDLVTVVEIRVITDCGLTYTIFTDVSTFNVSLTIGIAAIRIAHLSKCNIIRKQ